MVPLSVEEVWESASTDVHKLCKYGWNDRAILDLEVEASLAG